MDKKRVFEAKIFYENALLFKDLKILPTVSEESDQFPLLSWSYYERLMRITNKEERDWYLKELE